MGKLDKDGGKSLKLTRRQFVQASAAAAATGAAGLEFAVRPAFADTNGEYAATYHTTCPYCSASCGQLVDVDTDGNVMDIYGDHFSPFNDGGLCSKGAATFQLVTNKRRLGAFADNEENPVFSYDDSYEDGVAYKRIGNGDWEKVDLDVALDDIAAKLVAARGPINTPGQNSKGVAFFGSSHMNNEQNYTYRRLIAQFGTSNVEHQARI